MRIMELNETLDDLQNGYFIIQRNDGFKFGVDAVLLSDFAKGVKGRVMDLCTGTGIVPILLAAKSRAEHIDAVEIQPEIAGMSRRSVEYNKLEDKISIFCEDLKNAPSVFGKGVYDAVTVNPPYIKIGAGVVNCGDIKKISRHEVLCNAEDVISVASQLLKPMGKLFMVHRPSRLADVFILMRKYDIEPKILRPVSPRPGKEMNLVLICGMRCGKSDLKLMPSLYVYDGEGNYSKEIEEIYGR